MIAELQRAAEESFPNLSDAEKHMLRAVKSARAICGSNDDDSNPANNPQFGELWDESRTIRAGLIEWLCKNAASYGRSASDGIHVYGAKIIGELDLSHADIHLPLTFKRCAFTDEIWLKNAKILSLSLTGCWTKRILADGLQTANNIIFGDGFYAKGEVLFRDANIGGGFSAVGVTFEYQPSPMSSLNSVNSLACDRIKVDGSMQFYRSSFKGEVGLAGAFIGSNLECDGSTFENPFNMPDGRRFAIRADRVRVVGSVFLRNQFSAKGAVWFINGQMDVLDCSRGIFEGDGVTALSAERATIAGYAIFDAAIVRCGAVRLLGATTDYVTFRNAELTSVDMQYGTIRKALRSRHVRFVDSQDSRWDMQNASVGSIDDDEDSWPNAGSLFLDGCTYERFGSVASSPKDDAVTSPTDFKSRLRWLRLDTSNPPRAYKQLASVYSKMGDTLSSRAALYSLESLLHRHRIEQARWIPAKVAQWIWNQLLKRTIGYGYKLAWSLYWLIPLCVLGGGLSYWGYCNKIIMPTDNDAYRCSVQYGYVPNNYPRFSATMFTLEHSLPATNFAMSDHWAPGGRLRYWFMLQRIVGWILSIFFVAGITGLAKSDK